MILVWLPLLSLLVSLSASSRGSPCRVIHKLRLRLRPCSPSVRRTPQSKRNHSQAGCGRVFTFKAQQRNVTHRVSASANLVLVLRPPPPRLPTRQPLRTNGKVHTLLLSTACLSLASHKSADLWVARFLLPLSLSLFIHEKFGFLKPSLSA